MKNSLKIVNPIEDNIGDEAIQNYREGFTLASSWLSPLWDIRDYVAVNPFFGFKDKNFLDTAKYIGQVSGKDILPKKKFFYEKYKSGEITDYDLEVAKKLFFREGNNILGQVSIDSLINYVKESEHSQSNISIQCVSDLFDLEQEEKTTDLITKEISKWASGYFDEGQSVWKISNQNKRFYLWWKSLAKLDQPFKNDKIKFTDLVTSLPHDPEQALKILTDKLIAKTNIQVKDLSHYYYRLIFTILGWSSYIQKFEFEANRSGDDTRLNQVGGLIDMVVVRMAYDVALLDQLSPSNLNFNFELDREQNDLDYAYLWLNAAESGYRRSIEQAIKNSNQTIEVKNRPDVQMAFCIDVRSEILRRHLEHLSPNIQTIGFAGFFGMPIAVKKLGHHHSDQNCPILLNSAYEISEKAETEESSLIDKKVNYAKDHYLKKSMQGSANLGFSFVETFGFTYIAKMLKAGLALSKPNLDVSSMGLSEHEEKHIHLDTDHLHFDEKVNLAYGALKNMSLTENFAKFIFLFGHGSETANNPYASALDCGACAGHNGQANAEFLSSLLNDEGIRLELKLKGIEIPEDTIFFSGWHNTAKDDLIIDKLEEIPEARKDELDDYLNIFSIATMNCSLERAKNLPGCSETSVYDLKSELNNKANDWSEVRPEWGLARNAAFVVGRRILTRGLNLDGRSFLHDYDHETDHDLSKLELIMTAPMIVTNWINMQYYASTVEPEKFGAGNKVLNNVVGVIGCIQGNASDLQGGLSEQSVLYKGEYYHEPIRLQVFIEAETNSIDQVIQKHQLVQDLLHNNWLKVISIDPKTKEFKLYHSQEWTKMKDDFWN